MLKCQNCSNAKIIKTKSHLPRKEIKNLNEGEYSRGKKNLNEGQYNLFSVWKPPMICLAWEILGILGHFH
jgi:hypothetical protein